MCSAQQSMLKDISFRVQIKLRKIITLGFELKFLNPMFLFITSQLVFCSFNKYGTTLWRKNYSSKIGNKASFHNSKTIFTLASHINLQMVSIVKEGMCKYMNLKLCLNISHHFKVCFCILHFILLANIVLKIFPDILFFYLILPQRQTFSSVVTNNPLSCLVQFWDIL